MIYFVYFIKYKFKIKFSFILDIFVIDKYEYLWMVQVGMHIPGLCLRFQSFGSSTVNHFY